MSEPPPEEGKKQAEIREKRGRIAWEGNLEAMRTDEPTEFESDAERVSALTARFFEIREARADYEAFDRILNRQGGEPPRPGDKEPPE